MPAYCAAPIDPTRAMKCVSSVRLIKFDKVEQSAVLNIDAYVTRCESSSDISSRKFREFFDLKFARFLVAELQKDLYVKSNESICCLGSCFAPSHNCYGGLYFCKEHDYLGQMHEKRHHDGVNRLVSLCLIKDNTRYDHVKCAKDEILAAFAPAYNRALEVLNQHKLKQRRVVG